MAPFGAPPIFFVPYETFDAGATWQPVPVPDGYGVRGYGGLQVVNGAVEALFKNALAGLTAPLVSSSSFSGTSAVVLALARPG